MTPSPPAPDRVPDTNDYIYRWIFVVAMVAPVSSAASHSIIRSIWIFAIYAAAILMAGWLLNHPFKPLLIRYTRAFEAHSPRLIWPMAVICVLSAAILVFYMIYFFNHPGMHLDNLSVPACIPSWIAIALFLFTGIELAYCEHIHAKRTRSNSDSVS